MLRLILTLGFGFAVVVNGFSQLRKFYSLVEPDTYDTVDFNLKATSGISFIRHVRGGNPLNIFGNPDLDKINPSFDAQVINRSCYVNLKLDEYRESGFGDGLVFAMLKEKEEEESNYWKFLINDKKIYNLSLNYGIGSSDINLSNTNVHRLKIYTGSADVMIKYDENAPNQVEMDTFLVKVDLGSLEARDLEMARARNVIAEIGFGQALLDFSKPIEQTCDVKASVGAGKLQIILPESAPVIVHVKESPLCGVSMAKGYEEVENNVYVNMAYDTRAENLLTVKVDVAMGSVSFETAKD
jgi:hypothetical protein